MLKLGKKLNFFVIFWVLFYFLIFGLLLRNSFSYLDPDLGWHLKVGDKISSTGLLPQANDYNYTFTGDWVDHEWLINLVSSEIYNNYGYLSLNIFFALVIILALVFLNIFVRRFFTKIPEWLLAALQFFCLVASLPNFGVRMQELGFLFLLLELIIIKKFSDDEKWTGLIWLPPLFFLWSNIHGSFLLGLGVLLVWLGVKAIERQLLVSRWQQYFIDNSIVKKKTLKIFLGFSAFAFVVTFLTPYGRELYSFLGEYHNTFYLGVISEWLSQFSFPFNYWQLSYLALVVFALGTYLYKIKKNGEKADLWQLCLVFLFLILSFRSRRHFPLMVVATFPFLIKTLYEIFNLERIKWRPFKKRLKYLLLICLGLVGLNQYASLQIIVNPFTYFCSEYPCQATAFLQKNTQYNYLNILNEYNWGGYLIWVYPEKKLFIDGRIPQTEYAGHTFLEEYLEFLKVNGNYAEKLEQYDIGLVLIKTEDVIIKAKKWEKIIFWLKEKDLIFPNYLRQYLDSSSSWEKIYVDPLASIYLKIK
jgi:hypothetical protein